MPTINELGVKRGDRVTRRLNDSTHTATVEGISNDKVYLNPPSKRPKQVVYYNPETGETRPTTQRLTRGEMPRKIDPQGGEIEVEVVDIWLNFAREGDIMVNNALLYELLNSSIVKKIRSVLHRSESRE